MEQKKLLLIAISVGVFFVIVIGSALVFLKPAADMVSTGNHYISGTSYIGAGNPSGAFENQTPSYYPNLEESNYADSPVNEPQEDNASEPGERNNAVMSPAGSVDPVTDTSARTITVEAKPAAGVPDAPVTQRTTAAEPPRAIAAAPAPAPAARTAPAASAPQTSTARAVSPAPSRTRDDYWVQTGSFTALSRAENVKQTLADKGITSIIENRNVGDTLYFRVRIGPYTSQNEADYWLSLIKSINGFENSQVWKTQTAL